MRFQYVGFVKAGRLHVIDYKRWRTREDVASAQQAILQEPEIFQGEDGRYYVAPEGKPPPDLLPFDTLEAAVAAAIVLGN